MDKETKKLVKALEDAGFEVRAHKSGHATVYSPDGEYVSGLAGSPSEYRGWANTLSRIKRVAKMIYRDGKLYPCEA